VKQTRTFSLDSILVIALLYHRLSSFHWATHLSPSFHKVFFSTIELPEAAIRISPSSPISVSNGIRLSIDVWSELPNSKNWTRTLSLFSILVMTLLYQSWSSDHWATHLSPSFHFPAFVAAEINCPSGLMRVLKGLREFKEVKSSFPNSINLTRTFSGDSILTMELLYQQSSSFHWATHLSPTFHFSYSGTFRSWLSFTSNGLICPFSPIAVSKGFKCARDV